jgi:prepilin-type N-terminal cleavage/methylation domain-containing protein
MRPNERRGGGRGFTLIEVLVALVIFALVFGVLAQIFQSGLRQTAGAAAASEATMVARSQLARVGVELPLVAGEALGETADGLHWRTAIRLAEPPDEEQSFVPYLVEVTVAWGDGPAEQITLTTLRLGVLPQ